MLLFPTQSQDESRQQLREYEETKKQIEEDADREILDIKNKYERRLREEKEANLRLKGETGIMRKKVSQDLLGEKTRSSSFSSFEGKKENPSVIAFPPPPPRQFLCRTPTPLEFFPRPNPPLIYLFNMTALTLDMEIYALVRLSYVCIAGRSDCRETFKIRYKRTFRIEIRVVCDL